MKCLIITSLLFLSSQIHAKEWSWSDDLLSPFNTDAKYITMAGTLATAMVYSNKDFRNYKKRESLSSAQPFGKYGIIGDAAGKGILNVSYAVGALALGYYYEDKSLVNSGEHMAKASLYSTGLTVLMKNLINEKRPGYPDDPNSFPSGHSSASFAFASVITANHGWYWGSAAYFTAAFISLSRINDDFHYLHDVIFGLTIGTAYGWGTYYNYKAGKPYFLTPIFKENGGGMNVTWNF